MRGRQIAGEYTSAGIPSVVQIEFIIRTRGFPHLRRSPRCTSEPETARKGWNSRAIRHDLPRLPALPCVAVQVLPSVSFTLASSFPGWCLGRFASVFTTRPGRITHQGSGTKSQDISAPRETFGTPETAPLRLLHPDERACLAIPSLNSTRGLRTTLNAEGYSL